MSRSIFRSLGAACGLLLWLAPAPGLGAISARIEPPVIDELDMARLILRIDGSASAGDLDLSPLAASFEVVNTQSSTQISLINGRMQQSVEYSILLRPKQTGRLTIPPLQTDAGSSQALQLEVRPLTQADRQAVNEIMVMESEATPDPSWVQAQLIFTRRLLHAPGAQIHGDLPGPPSLPDALVTPLGEAQATTANRHGRSWQAVEQRYAIQPRQAGRLILPAESVTAAMQLPGRGNRRAGVPITSQPVAVEILPIPDAYPTSQPWLPVQALTISEAWQPNPPVFMVGEPLTRTLTINVEGNNAAAIPPIGGQPAESVFKVYPEPVRMQDTPARAGLQSLREERRTIIPILPGKASLPAVSITWWDTGSGQVRVARLPERRVQIGGQAPESAPMPDAGIGSSEVATQATTPAAGAGGIVRVGLAILLALAIGLLIGLKVRRRQRPRRTDSEPATVDAEAAWQSLRQACRQENLDAMRSAWLAYLDTLWGTSPGETLARIKASPEASNLLDRLNRALYAAAGQTNLNGADLLAETRELIERQTQAAESTLPPLHGKPA